jgi:hypothetical protein
MRTIDNRKARAGAATPDAELNRRAKQILAGNPGHRWEAALRAAEDEAEARRLASVAGDARKAEANAHLRAKQLQAGNLDLDYGRARDLARIHIAADHSNYWER